VINGKMDIPMKNFPIALIQRRAFVEGDRHKC
jgi:hypothetical protein